LRLPVDDLVYPELLRETRQLSDRGVTLGEIHEMSLHPALREKAQRLPHVGALLGAEDLHLHQFVTSARTATVQRPSGCRHQIAPSLADVIAGPPLAFAVPRCSRPPVYPRSPSCETWANSGSQVSVNVESAKTGPSRSRAAPAPRAMAPPARRTIPLSPSA